MFVDDGSKDNIWQLIKEVIKDKRFVGVKFLRNCGY